MFILQPTHSHPLDYNRSIQVCPYQEIFSNTQSNSVIMEEIEDKKATKWDTENLNTLHLCFSASRAPLQSKPQLIKDIPHHFFLIHELYKLFPMTPSIS